MSESTFSRLAWRWSLAACTCAPLVFLAGCPDDSVSKSPVASVPAYATAPTIQPAAAAATPAATPLQTQGVQNAQDATANYRAQQIIANAERSYKSGVANYQAGRLEAARTDFDFAVDAMLTSGMDLKGNQALADEFDRLLNAVNSLELAALKQGNGFSAPVEASPIESAADLTFPANPELTAKLKGELTTASDLPLVINDQVAGYINYFANSPSFHAHMLRSLERAGKYKDMIQKILREEGVPQDMIYLAVAESGFQPQAMNGSSGAGGMWQFMPTGAYGLKRNGWFDERFDPEKSSHAYARYIKALHNQFGDWYLAMAAYDWGPGNIQRAVMRTGYADFWELYRRNAMPAETRNYVPQILAAVIMAKNPEKYGLDKMVPDAPLIWDTVTVDYAVSLPLIADVTGTNVSAIVALNPSLLRMTTPNDQPFDLHIPIGTSKLYTERMKDIPEEKRATWRFHEAKAGETLASIASDMHVQASVLAEANEVSLSAPVEEGDEFVVPIAGSVASTHPSRYTTRRGDTLITIADRFNVSPEDLRRWNNLSSSAVQAGRSLAVAEPVHLAPSSRARARGRASKARGSRRSSISPTSNKSRGGATKTTTKGASTKTSAKPAAKSAKSSPHHRSSK
ncbi:membrane-bound lytic murein transglycosylase D [Granulicella pectinivorans]|jgi:membrane-bound lytic murein transglycosylase D|uniref:Membrane-bound lytic murein transglycosylase D n=1 Tax=Granulicella pectinivorans TaxID=474950 RepID=A0A1I6L072_9BACT|nr:lytic transglycosylase domain-containing protein [Granulicella pectinivorans]SFR96855.1 membrane-bound lytic murein transglycosylase D [Granulicella pectinivorans]